MTRRTRISAMSLATMLLATTLGASASVLAQGIDDLRLPFVGAARWSSTPSTHTGASAQAVDFVPEAGPDAWDGSVIAAQAGQVIYAGFQEDDPPEPCPLNPDKSFGYGNVVIIADEASGLQTYYAHLSSIAEGVTPGADIAAGAPIGQIGDSGCTDGIRLHFEAREGGGMTPFAGTSVNVLGLTGISPAGSAVGPALEVGGPGTSGQAPVLSGQWIMPTADATIGSGTELVAWPTSTLADIAVTNVVFRARWADGEADLCSATAGDADGLWRCTPDFAAAGVPAGAVQLSFDIFDDAGDMTAGADTLSVTLLAASPPKVSWAKGTTRSSAHVPFGDQVTLVAKVSADSDVSEVRFIAWYDGWAQPKDAAKVSGFSPKTWRVLAICRPTGASSPKGCRWQGDAHEATVTYEWDPTAKEKKRTIPGQPKARAAITPHSKACVPVALQVETTTVSGGHDAAPSGRVPRRCDATAKNLGRRAYLDPLTPPTAPANVVWTRCPGYSGVQAPVLACPWVGRASDLGWSDRSNDEDGFRVYARSVTTKWVGAQCQPTDVRSAWVLVKSVPADTTSWRLRLSSLPRSWQRTWASSRPTSVEFSVAAFNRAGESRRVGSESLVNENPIVPPNGCFAS